MSLKKSPRPRGRNGRAVRARFVEVEMPAVASCLVIELDGGRRILLSAPAPATHWFARMGGAAARCRCGQGQLALWGSVGQARPLVPTIILAGRPGSMLRASVPAALKFSGFLSLCPCRVARRWIDSLRPSWRMGTSKSSH